MAINTNPVSPLRHVATFNSSGNYLAPAGATLAFVSIHGASGGGAGGTNNGRYATGGPGGSGLVAGAFVQITPSGNHVVTVGAAGAAGIQGNSGNGGSGGTTSFDGALSVTGGTGGSVTQGRYSTGTGGNQSTASGTTSLTSLSPSGAIVRTGNISTQNTGAAAGGNGGVRYSAGAAGSAGQLHIYL